MKPLLQCMNNCIKIQIKNSLFCAQVPPDSCCICSSAKRTASTWSSRGSRTTSQSSVGTCAPTASARRSSSPTTGTAASGASRRSVRAHCPSISAPPTCTRRPCDWCSRVPAAPAHCSSSSAQTQRQSPDRYSLAVAAWSWRRVRRNAPTRAAVTLRRVSQRSAQQRDDECGDRCSSETRARRRSKCSTRRDVRRTSRAAPRRCHSASRCGASQSGRSEGTELLAAIEIPQTRVRVMRVECAPLRLTAAHTFDVPTAATRVLLVERHLLLAHWHAERESHHVDCWQLAGGGSGARREALALGVDREVRINCWRAVGQKLVLYDGIACSWTHSSTRRAFVVRLAFARRVSGVGGPVAVFSFVSTAAQFVCFVEHTMYILQYTVLMSHTYCTVESSSTRRSESQRRESTARHSERANATQFARVVFASARSSGFRESITTVQYSTVQ